MLDWLIEIQREGDKFSPIGNREWFKRGKSKSRFDLQPIEAHAMVETCLLVHNITGKDYYSEMSRLSFNWFLGQNDQKEPLYDYTTGGCKDGLTPDGENMNQGVESTPAWLLSLMSMYGFKAEQEKLQYTKYIQK